MANALFGYDNKILQTGAYLAATSQLSTLPVSNLLTPQGDASSGWQTATGITTATCLLMTTSVSTSWRAFAIARSNLSTAATLRWRVGTVDAIFEETPLFELNFSDGAITTPAGYAFTRSSKAWEFNSSGVLTEYANDTLRFAYDPVTLACLGARREETRTNSLRNPRAEGSTSGYLSLLGVMPTNWSAAISNPGLDVFVSGTGTETGIPYIDLQVTGSTGASAATVEFAFETATQIVAAQNQGWVTSLFAKLEGGSFGAGAAVHKIEEFTAVGASLASGTQGMTLPTNAALRTQRSSFTRTLTNASTARVRSSIVFSYASGQSVNFTVRIGVPQLEQGTIASTPMLPPIGSPGAFTRASEGCVVTGLSISPATGYSVCIDYTWDDDSVSPGSFVAWSLTPASTSFNDTHYSSASKTFNQVSLTILDSVNGNYPTQPVKTITHPTAVKVACSVGPSGAGLAANSLGISSNATVPTSNGTLIRLGIGGAAWSGGAGNTTGLALIRKFAVYTTRRLTNNQTIGWAASGSTLATAEMTFDSGTVAGTVAAGYGQSIITSNASVVGQACRCDISDPTNPDTFLNIPLMYAGPAWQPAMNVSPLTTSGRDDATVEFRSRGGQEFPTHFYQARRAEVDFQGILNSELWSGAGELDRYARMAGNVLYIPDPASSNVSREAIYGRVRPRADFTYTNAGPARRSWRVSVTERL